MMCSRVYRCCDGQSSKEDEITQVAAVTIVSLPLLQFPNIPDTRSVAGKTKPQATIEMALSYWYPCATPSCIKHLVTPLPHLLWFPTPVGKKPTLKNPKKL
jgi:hypothetical protein